MIKTSTPLRVRAAPSNTGPDLHIGNLRTILYNWLVARQNNGTFVLRIEDSDQARSKAEYAESIFQSLQWVGLTPDEGFGVKNQPLGPYMQSLKLDRYRQLAEQLIESGHCYRCYCTPEDLAAQKAAFVPDSPKAHWKYPGTCRDRKQEDKSKPFVVRFKAPVEGQTIVEDLVFGMMTVPNIENYDFVITRSNGAILYNWGCVVDDIDQKINLVIRGRDHLINCVPQILLYQALNQPLPQFAHLPMMLNQAGGKLSKRDCATGISQYKDLGYTPQGILNYLVKFGWGSGEEEIFTIPQLIEKFDLTHCKRSDGKFDPKKFAAIQYQHLKNNHLTDDEQYLNQITPFLKVKSTTSQLKQALPLVRTRAHTLIEAASEFEPFLSDEVPQGSVENLALPLKEKMTLLVKQLQESIEWSEGTLRETTQGWLKQNNLSLKEVGGFLRWSLTGRTHSPELFQVMQVLGRHKSIERLEKGLRQLNAV